MLVASREMLLRWLSAGVGRLRQWATERQGDTDGRREQAW
jgi:hypothetical protein